MNSNYFTVYYLYYNTVIVLLHCTLLLYNSVYTECYLESFHMLLVNVDTFEYIKKNAI